MVGIKRIERRRIGLGAALCVLLQAVFGGAPASPQSAPPAPQAACVFTNPAYSGKCAETTPVPKGSSAQQACEAILQCLNDVRCLKTYCQATTIRNGWKLESARPAGPEK